MLPDKLIEGPHLTPVRTARHGLFRVPSNGGGGLSLGVECDLRKGLGVLV